MQTRRTLRLLTPLLAAFVAACNINDTEVVGNASRSTGSLAPRLVAASGSLTPSDRVLIQLWLKDTSSAKEPTKSVESPWAEGSVRLDSIPLNTPWRLKISGITNSDTLWYGGVGGTLSSPSTAAYSVSSPEVLVRNVTARPSYSTSTGTGTKGLVQGDTLRFAAADSSSRLLLLAEGDSLDCTMATPALDPVVLPAGTYRRRLVSCREGSWPSTGGWFTLDVSPRLGISQIEVPTDGAVIPLDTLLSFRSTTGTGTLLSALSIKALDSVFTESDRSSLIRKATPGGTQDLKALALAVTPRSADSAHALIAVILYADAKPVDTLWRTWKISLPKVEAPAASIMDRTDSTVTFAWQHTTAHQVRISSLIGSAAWSEPATQAASGTLRLTATAIATPCSLSVTAIDTVTGRESVPFKAGSSTRNRPSLPTFTASNTSQTDGTVTLRLTNSPKDTGTVWQVGTSTAELQHADFDAPEFLGSNAQWSSDFNAGLRHFGLRAIRDGDTVYSKDTAIQIVRTKAAAPKMPAVSLTRDSTSLTFGWTASSGRLYRVFYRIGSLLTDTLSGVVKDTTSKGSFHIGSLSQGVTVHFRVYAVSTNPSDSAGGLSSPANAQGTTKIRPSSQALTSLAGTFKDGSIAWTWSTDTSIRYSLAGTTKILPKGGLNSLTTPVAEKATDMPLSVRACNADSLCTLPLTVSVHIPQNRGTPSLSSWDIHQAGDLLTLYEQPSGEVGDTIVLQFRDTSSSLIHTFRRTASDAPFAKRLSFESMATVKLQYRWRNGDTSFVATTTKEKVLAASLKSIPAAVENGQDFLDLTKFLSPPSGWATDFLAIKAGTTPTPLALNGSILKAPLGSDTLEFRYVSGKDSTPAQKALILRHFDSIVDKRDGTTYHSIKIGGKLWLGEPLNYRGTDASPYGACLDNKEENCASHGRLYTWAEAMQYSPELFSDGDLNGQKGLCPEGYHVPTQTEIVAFFNSIVPGWNGKTPIVSRMNDVGFRFTGNAINSGARYAFGQILWAASLKNDGGGIRFYQTSSETLDGNGVGITDKNYMHTVRCIAD